MGTFTLVPVSDILTTGWLSTDTAPVGFATEIDEGFPAGPTDNTEYVSSSGTSTLKVQLGDLPADFDFADSVTYKVRVLFPSAKAVRTLNLRLYESDGTTPLTGIVSILSTDQNFTTYTAAFAITGTNTVASWTDAQLHLDGDTAGTGVRVIIFDADFVYTETAGGGGPLTPGVIGGGGFNKYWLGGFVG